MKLSKFANLVKNGGRCAVLHVAGSGIWLSTGTAIYRATELPDMEGSEQVRTVLDMTADAWKKVYLTEDWPESVSNVLGLNLAPYAQGEQDTEKLKVAAAPNGLWCSACRCKVDGELIFYNEAYLAPLAEEIKKSEYIYYTARQTEAGQRYLVVHDGMDVLAAIMPMNILKEEYINDLAEFQALCMEQFYKDILETGICWREKGYALTASSHSATAEDMFARRQRNGVAEPIRIGTIENDAKKQDFDSQQYRMRYCGTHAEEEPRRQQGDYCQYCGHRLREIGRERFCNNVNCRNRYVNV